MFKAIAVLALLPGAALAYEEPYLTPAAAAAPGLPLSGEDYRVWPDALADGANYRFILQTERGEEEVVTADLLRERLAELHVIRNLADRNTAVAFARAFGGPLTKAADKAGEWITKPAPAPAADRPGFLTRSWRWVKGAPGAAASGLWGVTKSLWRTAAGAPAGAYRQARRLGEMAAGERGDLEDGEWREVLGFSSTKRKVAAEAGADVYSSNAALQRELGRLSWARLSGSRLRSFALGFAPIPAAVQQPWSNYKLADRLARELKEQAPEDLRRLNRNRLKAMGAKKRQRAALLENKAYSPRHMTAIVLALEAMGQTKDRPLALWPAVLGGDEAAARRHARMTELLAAYHLGVAPLERIVLAGEVPAGLTAEGRLIAMLPADHLQHSYAAAQLLRELAGTKAEARELWLTGSASAALRADARALNVTLVEQAAERLPR